MRLSRLATRLSITPSWQACVSVRPLSWGRVFFQAITFRMLRRLASQSISLFKNEPRRLATSSPRGSICLRNRAEPFHWFERIVMAEQPRISGERLSVGITVFFRFECAGETPIRALRRGPFATRASTSEAKTLHILSQKTLRTNEWSSVLRIFRTHRIIGVSGMRTLPPQVLTEHGLPPVCRILALLNIASAVLRTNAMLTLQRRIRVFREIDAGIAGGGL